MDWVACRFPLPSNTPRNYCQCEPVLARIICHGGELVPPNDQDLHGVMFVVKIASSINFCECADKSRSRTSSDYGKR
jgi:hypothetical protein